MLSPSPLLPFLLSLFFLPHLSLSLNREGLSLLQAKHSLADPGNALSDWNPLDSTPCNWTGVTCGSTSLTVTSLDLSNFALAGPFPSALCRLPRLSFLSLAFNLLNDTVPSSSLLGCSSLAHLDLSQNSFVGPLPSSLPSILPDLVHLDLSANNFSGDIPPSFGQFPRLRILSLVANELTGPVPSFLSNLTSLRELNLSYNPFSPSPIPVSFANLTQLRILWLAGSNLVGPVPPDLGRLSSLVNLDLAYNSLSGPIPESIAGLSSAVQIELYANSLSGSLPRGFSNLTALRFFDASTNKLSGHLPGDIFLVPNLANLQLYENNLVGRIPQTISRCKNLADLRLFSNQLDGPLPSDFGSLPQSLGRCTSLTRVRLPNNRLSGEVSPAFWGLPHVWLLELTGNFFSGGISSVISGAANLSVLLISDNQFSGQIPEEIGALSNLYEFSAANNMLSGPLPMGLRYLTKLGELDLHNNSLSGELPHGIQSWKKLSQLNLAYNDISGGIPPELGDLPVLNYLDLSGNKLSGEIPMELQNLMLIEFNLSNNQLSGCLPPLLATQTYQNSFLGNPGLCGDLTGFCPSPRGVNPERRVFVWLLRSVFVLASLVLVTGAAWFYWRYRNLKKAALGMDNPQWKLTSFYKLGFSEEEILVSLDEDNVIGSGASGQVYKVVLGNGETVAVKKLWGTSKKNDVVQRFGDGFEAEVEILGKIRHKNIVKLWCCCTNNDSKLLVYEYMPNGSLGDQLHGAKGEFGAKVSDFGVAKAIVNGPKSMSVIAGSCGYIAPEYAYTLRVTEKSDIYSFGVVILELVTGRFPMDPELGERDLAQWACSTMEQKGVESVIDPRLSLCFKEEIRKVLDVGLLCTNFLPLNRPPMRTVVKLLLDVAPVNKLKPPSKDLNHSP
ncbi:hypothetical protein OPV22_014240 [Ensete ventricosum]|uniref:Protein kinase domain-containing protein n=1 Tax=Ensete ventricosum TaxID=4639 RepID=A0AAV8PJF5_ENSVE|nr:hypothetical protein OPV22_014240 [Ensete ventricosum]